METEGRIEKLEAREISCALWRSEHDGRINAWWEAQRTWNGETVREISSVEKRVTQVENRIMFVTGAAAILGSAIGSLVIKAFG